MLEHETGDCLKELFRNVHGVEELLGQLSLLSSQLHEVAANAAIASGHVESQAKIFNEIAKQIDATSALLIQLSERSKKRTSQISAQVLTVIANSSQRETFFSALTTIAEGSNKLTVEQVCASLGTKISKQLESAHVDLAYLIPEQDHLNQTINRITSIVLSLRILANSAENGEETFLLSIVESLERVSDQAVKHCASILHFIDEIETSLSERCNCMREDLYGT